MPLSEFFYYSARRWFEHCGSALDSSRLYNMYFDFSIVPIYSLAKMRFIQQEQLIKRPILRGINQEVSRSNRWRYETFCVTHAGFEPRTGIGEALRLRVSQGLIIDRSGKQREIERGPLSSSGSSNSKTWGEK
jgi:hypothetical protein